MWKTRAIQQIQAGFTGTGTYNLGSAYSNAQEIDLAFSSGGKGGFVARTVTWSKWEEFDGVVTSGSPDTLTRNVQRSWNGTTYGTSAVNWLSGDHPIYIYSAPGGEMLSSMLKSNAATSRPGWLPQYGIWVDTDTPSGTVWTIKFFDGTDDISLGTIDSVANTYAASGSYVPLAGGVTITGHITLDTAIQLKVPAGTSGAPSIARSNNLDTGVSFDTTDEVAVVINATKRLNVSATAVAVTGNITATGDISSNGTIYADADTDLNWSMSKSGGNPLLVYDSGDYAGYLRSTNQFLWSIGSSTRVTLTATVLDTTPITINAGNIALQAGAALTHVSGGGIDINGNHVLRQYANVAALPSAASNSGRMVQCMSTTSPGTGPLAVVSDGSVWRDGTGNAIS